MGRKQNNAKMEERRKEKRKRKGRGRQGRQGKNNTRRIREKIG